MQEYKIKYNHEYLSKSLVNLDKVKQSERELKEINMKQVRGVSAAQINQIISNNVNSLEIIKMGRVIYYSEVFLV